MTRTTLRKRTIPFAAVLAALLVVAPSAGAQISYQSDGSLPVAVGLGVQDAGEGKGVASCDLLATGCAAAAAATGRYCVKATGTVALFGGAEFEACAEWGVGAGGGLARTLFTAAVLGAAQVTSTVPEPADPGDKCAWYEFWCDSTAGAERWDIPKPVEVRGKIVEAADPDKLVAKSTCERVRQTILTPHEAGSVFSCIASASAVSGARCFDAEAKGSGRSDITYQSAAAAAEGCRTDGIETDPARAVPGAGFLLQPVRELPVELQEEVVRGLVEAMTEAMAVRTAHLADGTPEQRLLRQAILESVAGRGESIRLEGDVLLRETRA